MPENRQTDKRRQKPYPRNCRQRGEREKGKYLGFPYEYTQGSVLGLGPIYPELTIYRCCVMFCNSAYLLACYVCVGEEGFQGKCLTFTALLKTTADTVTVMKWFEIS